MPKTTALPRLPDSPGAWIACFRHRASGEGRPLSPEQFARLIGRSGATVRRWESNTLLPDEKDIARIAEVACLTSQQAAFLSYACSNMRSLPAPDERDFKAYMTEILGSLPFPAMVLDGLLYTRAWNSYVDVLARGTSKLFRQDLHTVTMMLRARPQTLSTPDDYIDTLRRGLRLFWMNTSIHSHRPEYSNLIQRLQLEPHFRDLWMELALGTDDAPGNPISFTQKVTGAGATYCLYTRTIMFPPTYYLHVYQPADDAARSRLATATEAGPPRVCFSRRLHWVDAGDCC